MWGNPRKGKGGCWKEHLNWHLSIHFGVLAVCLAKQDQTVLLNPAKEIYALCPATLE